MSKNIELGEAQVGDVVTITGRVVEQKRHMGQTQLAIEGIGGATGTFGLPRTARAEIAKTRIVVMPDGETWETYVPSHEYIVEVSGDQLARLNDGEDPAHVFSPGSLEQGSTSAPVTIVVDGYEVEARIGNGGIAREVDSDATHKPGTFLLA